MSPSTPPSPASPASSAAPGDGSRYEVLKRHLASYGRLAVGYSGGVDSTLVMRAALDALGPANVLAIIAASATLAPGEFEPARDIARRFGFPLQTIAFSHEEVEAFATNPPDRCYHCKKYLFGRIAELARREGFATVADGTTADDLTDDYRPGMRAAHELNVISPLADLGLRKAEIREMARALGLPNWNKPSAACLASRFPYGAAVTTERLAQVAAAEKLLHDHGFAQARVRWHDTIARIEVPAAEVARLAAEPLRTVVVDFITGLGFRYVTLDLRGYRTGSLNEVL